MTAHTVRRPCWVLSLPGDSERAAHLATCAEAAVEARAYGANHGTRAPRFRRLTGFCAALTCDDCGQTLADDGDPMHFESLEAGVQAAEFAGWTSNETCTLLHCDECSASDPLPASPLSAYRFPAVIDVPLPGLEGIA